MPTFHVCLDEAGNLKFKSAGSRYYVFAVAWTLDPIPVARDLSSLRYDLLKQGYDIPSFHASNDKQAHRDAVVGVLQQHANWRFAAIVVEKCKVNPSLYPVRSFYSKFGTMAFRFVFRGVANAADRVLTFTDRLPINSRREGVENAFKGSCRNDLPPGCRSTFITIPVTVTTGSKSLTTAVGRSFGTGSTATPARTTSLPVCSPSPS